VFSLGEIDVIGKKEHKWTLVIIAFVTLTALTITSIPVSLANPSFGEDCLECHQTGLTISTNATEPIQLEPNSEFWIEVTASGGSPREVMLVWSNVSHNSHFVFTPNEVEDNDSFDIQSDEGTITALFKVTAPSLPGNYAIQTIAASSGLTGGMAEVDIIIGGGGVVPISVTELILGLITQAIPQVLVGIVFLTIILYFVNWRRIRGGVH
jgi:hypothetical protein